MVLDKINFVDEVPEGEPKFNITDNGDGTKNIELANNIIQEGTNLNKLTFDKIDNNFNKVENIIKYNIPTYTTSGGTEKKFNNLFVQDLSVEFTSAKDLNTNTITSNLTPIETITPTLTFKSNVGFYAYDSYLSDKVVISPYYSSASTKSSLFITNFQRSSTQSAYRNYFFISRNANLDLIYDFKKSFKIKIKGDVELTNTTLKLMYSDNGTDWEIYNNSVNGEFTITTTSSHRYWKLHCEGSTTTTSRVIFYYLYINEIISTLYDYSFTIDTEVGEFNNQIIKLQPPNGIDVLTNTLNNIPIDTILESGKNYELIYNQTQNKLIAEEI